MTYPRFRWLLPNKVAGAPHPGKVGGLARVAGFLRAQGVGAIVTVHGEPLTPDPSTLGFSSLCVPTPYFRPPPDLPRIIDFIDAQLAQDRAVVVHCMEGIGRTGTVLAVYLLHVDPKLDADQAISWIRERYLPESAGGRFPEDETQAAAIREFAAARAR